MNKSGAYTLNSRCNQIAIIILVISLILYTWHFPILTILSIFTIIIVIAVFGYILYWPIAIIYALLRAVIKKFRVIKVNSLSDIDNLNWSEFENYVADCLRLQGYSNVNVTEKYDLGVDIVAITDDYRLGVQVKHYESFVGIEAVREAVAGLKIYGCNQAMVVTNSYFTKPAIKLAKCNNCILINRNSLKNWR